MKSELYAEKHAQFIARFAKETNSFVACATEHFRLSGVYWGVTALHLLGKESLLDKEQIISWVLSCQRDDGGFGGSERHASHMLYTYSAIQVLAVYDALDQLNASAVATCEYSCHITTPNLPTNTIPGQFSSNWVPRALSERLLSEIVANFWKHEYYTIKQSVASLRQRLWKRSICNPHSETRGSVDVANLQNEDGSFCGDEWGEIDTRFSYCALGCLALLKQLDQINVASAANFVVRCRTFDGGFGITPGNESHAGQIFTCVAALAVADALHTIDTDSLCWWVCERQKHPGGLNGRPEKQEDVCYSWWCLTALKILNKLHWISADDLIDFILSCQDPDRGGISDRADDECDVFHTFFGIAALSLLDFPGLKKIDPVYALPVDVVQRCLAS